MTYDFFDVFQNFAAQMAGGFDEKAGGAQMGVMQGPMVSERWWWWWLQSAAYESTRMLQFGGSGAKSCLDILIPSADLGERSALAGI